MKKSSLLFFAVLLSAAFSLFSCQKDDTNEANVQFAMDQTNFSQLNYAKPVTITGTVTADKAITAITFTGVKKNGNTYTAVGDAQSIDVTGAKTMTFNMDYFVDAKTITDIEVKVNVGDASKSYYIPVSSVTGDAQGSALFLTAVMEADSIVWNAENHPEVYTTPNTGAAATTPSFFSIDGVEINGEVKHVLTGDEMRSVEGKNGSFCFLNCLQNTSNRAYIGSQRGYMFSNLMKTQLGGGTTGRQCDLYEIGGKAIRTENVDTTQFKIIAGSWIGQGWDEARYKFVDSLFVVLGKDATTEGQKLKAYYLLGKIQEKLDNATLGETNNPVSLGAQNYARRRTNAGTSGTSAMTENFRSGDYIIIKNQKNGKFYYGIMQIKQMFDDTSCMVNVAGVGDKIDQEKAKTLFHQPIILDIRMQKSL